MSETETFADVVDVMRKAASGDFDGACGDVWGNLMILTDRGYGDSAACMLDELCDRLEAAHEHELQNPSREYMRETREEHAKARELAAEYWRGYTDGKGVQSRDAERLERQRMDAVCELRNLQFDERSSSSERLAAIGRCFVAPMFGWTQGACEHLVDALVWLLGGGDSDE